MEEQSRRKSIQESLEQGDDFYEVIEATEEGQKWVQAGDGNRYVVEPDGSQWLQFSVGSGLQYDGPEDLLGIHPE